MISCLTNKLAYSSICGSPAKCSRRVAEEAPEFRTTSKGGKWHWRWWRADHKIDGNEHRRR
ncbi:Orn/Lys/Arg decarboxylase, C-terminal domain [Musa troglodytarum]|uniref:Orn/Lys/Arg decarboxylase, C-terminal domain n=1 Tax=Musa troglodytarum TaxID=320322 RepID=A0A9E7LEC9_9LILI|nr:Orn/Lys/Arg decarboxylase, C-terminal domain [Musa troglodytarum]